MVSDNVSENYQKIYLFLMWSLLIFVVPWLIMISLNYLIFKQINQATERRRLLTNDICVNQRALVFDDLVDGQRPAGAARWSHSCRW